MAAPTNPANVKKVLANPEPSTHDPKRNFAGMYEIRVLLDFIRDAGTPQSQRSWRNQ
jgi:hypothetical protein